MIGESRPVDAQADASRRLELLTAAGELADGSSPYDEVVPRLLDLLVPALADRCAVYGDGGNPRVAGVRAAGPGAAAIEAAILRRPPPALPSSAALLAQDEVAAFDARSGVLLPLRVRGQPAGSLLLAAARPDAYAPADLRFLQVLAGRLAVALDNARLVIAERELAALVAAMEDAVTVLDGDGQIVRANPAAARLMKADSVQQLLETPTAELWERFALYDPEGRPLSQRDLPHTRRGEPVTMLLRRVDRATGEQRWLLSKPSVLHDAQDRPTLTMYVTEDVTEAKRAELGQRLLVEAGRLLSSASDLDATLQQVADLTIPALADWCAIELHGPGGRVQQVALAHLEPGKVALGQRLRARYPVHVDDAGVVAGVIRSGVPVRLDNFRPEQLRALAKDAEHLELLEAVGLSALLCVPLRSGDDVLGALTLVASQPHRRFDDADQAVAEALAQRVADALRNARLLRDRAEIATVLSAGLRPEPSPVLPGCDVAAVYRPAGEDVQAGGDFYEVIDAPAGSIVVMGDVVGKGAPAAALSAVSRVTLRTAGRLTGDPRAALDELNHVLRRRGAMSLCTVVAIALPTELPGLAEVLLAGHPPPLLLRDGVARPVGTTGPMLGAVEAAEWKPATVELAPGDIFVLYTDGVLDNVLPGGERFGEERLRRLVEGFDGDVDAIAAGLEAELGGLRLRDDVAMLAIRCPGPPPLLARGTLGEEAERLLELTLPGGPAAPAAARSALATALGGRLSDQLEGDALIVVSELVTNAIRHGGARSPDDEVGVHAALRDEVLRLEVTDPGPGFEPGGHGPRPDGGYGLHMLDRLAMQWGVTGGDPVTVWVELDRTARLR
jgi:serine phosphatase RsbU (regulator of sigma subunit)/PAS domain-containing protein/anti-sigma regulatory factor (Ser/Thr protein kinase)